MVVRTSAALLRMGRLVEPSAEGMRPQGPGMRETNPIATAPGSQRPTTSSPPQRMQM
jgi:hypothetical protein